MAQAVRRNNWFAIWVTVAVIAAIAVITVIVVWMNNAAASPGTAPDSANINAETGAIVVGDGPNTIATYIDFICPACNSFEQAYSDTIMEQVDEGNVTLEIHPIGALDRYSQGTEYSSRAAGALYCVAEAEPDRVVDFMSALYENQPAENTAGLSDEQIVQIAGDAGVSDTDALADCLADGEYKRYAQSMTPKTPIQPGLTGVATPTVVINGETLNNQEDLTGDPQADIVDRLQ